MSEIESKIVFHNQQLLIEANPRAAVFTYGVNE